MSGAVYISESMHGLFRYIEENLALDLNTGLLSSVGYASHAKLYRSFYNLTGHSVMEYVRKRKLSNALAHIKTSDAGLTDIAFQCGYSSHQALCRAIRQTL
ncbi:MAG TPA: AraC family transcriptional regulator, partial [Clostridia bacterium]|nr:AraC family transcriptional regulator [Clostridia bacterium]